MPRWVECKLRHRSSVRSCARPNRRATYTLASPIPHAVPEHLPRLPSREREATTSHTNVFRSTFTRPFISRASVVQLITSPRTVACSKVQSPPARPASHPNPTNLRQSGRNTRHARPPCARAHTHATQNVLRLPAESPEPRHPASQEKLLPSTSGPA